MPYRRSNSRRAGYSRGRSYTRAPAARPRRATTRRAPARGRASARGGTREVRIVIEQAQANPVARGNVGLMNTLLRSATPAAKRSKL